MRVLFQIRKGYLNNMAGDSIVMLNLKKNLEEIGVEIDVSTNSNMNLKSYDIVHIFNTIRVSDSFNFIRNAKTQKAKTVLTPMYWDHSAYYRWSNQSSRLQRWNIYEDKRRYVFKQCDICLVHCEEEKKIIIQKYRVKDKYEIIPFGVDLRFIEGEENYLISQYGIKDYILSVGRIHPHKNQLGLIKAMSKENIPIVLVGPINDSDYYKKCLKEGNDKVLILNKLDVEQLRSIYKSAKVHALPSWGECPGLVSLEAGLAGCNVVTTEIGTTRDVCKEYVQYCHPRKQESIYNAVMTAYETVKNEDFKSFILENYTWMKAAEKTKRVYERVIEK